MSVVIGISYAEPDDFRALALPAGALESLTDDMLRRFLRAASRKAESLGLRARYGLPLETWGEDIVEQVCNLAVWPVMRFRGHNPEAGQQNQYKATTEAAEEWFRELGERVVQPELPDTILTSPVPQIVSKSLRGI